ncbi:MAG: hypothetical protein Q8Q11_02640 [bacterium]|nr:hypothetical protein [bacterium]
MQAIEGGGVQEPHLVRWIGRGLIMVWAALLVLATFQSQIESSSGVVFMGAVSWVFLLAGCALTVWDPVSKRTNDIMFRVVLAVPAPILLVSVYWLCTGFLRLPLPLSIALAVLTGSTTAILGLMVRKVTAKYTRG